MNFIFNNWKEENFRLLIDNLKLISKNEYRNFQNKLIPTSNEIIGVTIPNLRKIAKEIERGNVESFLDLSFKFSDYLEINILQALIIAHIKDLNTFMCYFNKFLPYINNWCVSDIFIPESKIIDKNKELFWKICEDLILTNKTYFIRVACLIYLKYFTKLDFRCEMFDNLQLIKNNDYYVNMAVAWLLAENFIYRPEKVYNYLLCSCKSEDIKLKTKQKIKDSYRVDKNSVYYKKVIKL